MKAKASQPNKFLRIVTMPYRALCKARDFYVNRIIDCTNSNVVGLRTASQAPPLPRSFSRVSSVRSSDDSEDFRELVRAASASWRNSRLEEELTIRAAAAVERPRALPPRSVSVGMGRIDEERPLNHFGEADGSAVNGGGKKADLKYPRSKSHAVARTAF